jgi:ABC-type Zn2+ transport system substrate-binding protein/surface adhesin
MRLSKMLTVAALLLAVQSPWAATLHTPSVSSVSGLGTIQYVVTNVSTQTIPVRVAALNHGGALRPHHCRQLQSSRGS